MTKRTVEVSSDLAADRRAVLQHIGTLDGVNQELRPIFTMTAPRLFRAPSTSMNAASSRFFDQGACGRVSPRPTVRVVSILPSATEMVCALGAKGELVGISRACDYPEDIRDRPVLTSARIAASGSSKAIDAAVRDVVRDALSIYAVSARRASSTSGATSRPSRRHSGGQSEA